MLNSQVPVQIFQIDDSSPSAILFGDDKKGAVKTSLVVTFLYCSFLQQIAHLQIQYFLLLHR